MHLPAAKVYDGLQAVQLPVGDEQEVQLPGQGLQVVPKNSVGAQGWHC